MAITSEQFWHLAARSGLLTAERCQALAQEASQSVGPVPQGNLVALAEWLVKTRVISRYQAAVLLKGQPGPFHFGEYQVFDRIGKGRLKGVFRAIHLPTKYVVYLRALTGSAAQDAELMKAVATRLAAAAKIKHEAVSRCYHLVGEGNHRFIACEALEGSSLTEYITRNRKLSAVEACRIANACATALAEMHAHGVFHTSVRPSNVWILPDGRVKLLQLPLGIDPLVDPKLALTALAKSGQEMLSGRGEPSPSVVRRLDYIAPEIVAGDTTPQPSGDIYGLGCTLYAMLSGQAPPLGVESPAQRLRFREEREVPALDDAHPDVPRPVAKLVSFMLAREPANRYQQAAHVVEAMKPFAGAEANLGEPPSPQSMAYQQWLEKPASRSQSTPAFESSSTSAFDDQGPGFIAGSDSPSGDAGSITISTTLPPRRNSGGKAVMFVATILLLLAAAGGGYWYLSGSDIATEIAPSGSNEIVATESSSSVEGGMPPDDDSMASTQPTIRSPLGPPLWESPTSGEPIDLAYLPPGVQIVFAIRPAALVTHPEGNKLLDALGKWAEYLRKDLVEFAGTSLNNIERVSVGLLDNSPNAPQLGWVIWTAEPISWDQRLDQWEGGEAFELLGQRVFQRDELIFFAPREGKDRQLVVVPRSAAEDVIASSGKPPRLRRELEVLAEQSDDQRMINVLFAPNFLFTGAKQLFADEGESLKQPLAEFLGSDARGGLFSLHLDDDLFLELRLEASGDVLPLVMAKKWRERVHEIPARVSSHVWSLNPSPYSQKMLAQLPRMIEAFEKYTRAAVEGRETILRCYLPVAAAHNLVLGTQLALLETNGSTQLVLQPSNEPTMEVAERLKQPYALSVPRGPLDQVIAQVSLDLGVEITILGSDLQLEGITKNQSFGLDIEDSTYAGVLQEILKLANPDGKLVYVIQSTGEGGEEMINITTRAAAAARGDTLPPEFTAE